MVGIGGEVASFETLPYDVNRSGSIKRVVFPYKFSIEFDDFDCSLSGDRTNLRSYS